MGLFKRQKDAAEEKDVVGGSRLFDTGLANFVIEQAFFTESGGGATAVNIHAKCMDTGKILKAQEWVASGDAKGNKHYYEKDGNIHYLPGFLIVNSICQLATDFELFDLDEEDEDHIQMKTVNVWNTEAKAEKPTSVATIMPLLGTKITLGVIRQIVDKTKQDGDQRVPTGETREENIINKAFQHETLLTVQEIKAGEDEGVFVQKWKDTYNETIDKSKGAGKGGDGATSGAPKSSGQKKKLFGNKNKG